MKQTKTRRMTLLAFFIALEIAFMLVPFLGFVPIPPVFPTTMHIPVIVAAIVLGPKEGALVGFIFGLLSIVKATITPQDLTAFMFSPFVTFGDMSGNINSVFLALVPRTLIGVSAGYSFRFFKQLNWNTNISVLVASVIGSFTNTILVLLGIYLLFGVQYAQLLNINLDVLQYSLLALVGTNGVAEAILAAVICLPVYKASEIMLHKNA